MAKIQKNRSDREMMVGFEEPATFETMIYREDDKQSVKASAPVQSKETLHASFFTAELQEKIGKHLLDIKLELYKQGIIDYKIEVVRQQGQVILKTTPVKPKKQS